MNIITQFYIYALIVIAIFSYAVFILCFGAWWFLMAYVLIDLVRPTITTKKEKTCK